MSDTQQSNLNFIILAVIAILGSALSLTMLWPSAQASAKYQSAQLAQEGSGVSPEEATVDYQLALWLDPANKSAYIGLASTQIAQGNLRGALASLSQAGEGSAVTRQKIRAYIELRNYPAATKAANQLMTEDGQTIADSDITLAALAYSLAGKSDSIGTLIPRLTSPEAVQRVQGIQVGQLTLARELYAEGLIQSSSALLKKQPSSFERDLLLAYIDYTQNTSDSLNQAAEHATAAINQNPASIEARQLYIKILHEQDKTPEAASQESLLAKLQAGRP